MTQQPQPSRDQPTRRSRLSILWRLVAIGVVIVATFVVAHYLRDPGALTRDDTPFAGATERGQAFSGAAGTGPADDQPASAAGTEERRNLRQVMAGLVMAASDAEEGEFEDPRNRTPEARRRFIADRFALPFDYPRSAAPADLVPDDAQVLVVFENPRDQGQRMVLVRLRKDIHGALSDFHKRYGADGWKLAEPLDPEAQADRGWLLRFARGSDERLVYARARQDAEETLAVICDSRY